MTKQEVMALFQDDVEVRKKIISDYIKSDAPYEDRLEVFQKTPGHLYTEQSWIIHLEKFDKKYGEISWYDDFYTERYSIQDLTDIDSYKDDWDEEKIRDFYEEVMSMGIHSFKMDW